MKTFFKVLFIVLFVIVCVVLLRFAFVYIVGIPVRARAANSARLYTVRNVVMVLYQTYSFDDLDCIVQITSQKDYYYHVTYDDGQMQEKAYKKFPTVTVKVGDTEETLAKDGYRVVGKSEFHTNHDVKVFTSPCIPDNVVVYLSSADFAKLSSSV